MVTVYTNINKASGTSYTPVSGGNTLFNDPMIPFDDPLTAFDGNRGGVTKITKASGTSYTNIPKGS